MTRRRVSPISAALLASLLTHRCGGGGAESARVTAALRDPNDLEVIMGGCGAAWSKAHARLGRGKRK